ncbi:MAG TPA: hypothetical protein VFS00_34595, partial [Polyangiaceae bacterium]|nr:hypothetical protein [Polyangiaceae bacterium]
MINESVFNPPGADKSCYLELKGPPGASLAGYTLRAINGNGGQPYNAITFGANAALDANGYFVVAQDNTVLLPPGAAVLINGFPDLQNGPDSVALVGPDGVVLDALGYSDGLGKFDPPNVFAGEGKFALQPTGPNEGASLSRLPDGGDTNDNATDFGFGERTPGAANVAAGGTAGSAGSGGGAGSGGAAGEAGNAGAGAGGAAGNAGAGAGGGAGAGAGGSGGGGNACTPISIKSNLVPLTGLFGDVFGYNTEDVSPDIVFVGGADEFRLELYGTSLGLPPLVPGTFDLASGIDNNYATCAHCFRLFALDSAGNLVKQFYQESGILDLTQVSDPLTPNAAALVTGLKLVEV